VVHALARLALDQFDFFHLFFVVNSLEKLIADEADFYHNHPIIGVVKRLAGGECRTASCEFTQLPIGRELFLMSR
jgi:hypothetical protein